MPIESPAPGCSSLSPPRQVFWVNQARIVAVLLILQGLLELGYWLRGVSYLLPPDEPFVEMTVLLLIAHFLPVAILAALKIGAGLATYHCRLRTRHSGPRVYTLESICFLCHGLHRARQSASFADFLSGELLSLEKITGLIVLVYGLVVYCSPIVRREFLARRRSNDSLVFARLFIASSAIRCVPGILALPMLAGTSCLPEPLGGYLLFVFMTYRRLSTCRIQLYASTGPHSCAELHGCTADILLPSNSATDCGHCL